MTDRVRLELDGAIAIITNDNPEKHNAFDDEMDARLFEILSELRGRSEVRRTRTYPSELILFYYRACGSGG